MCRRVQMAFSAINAKTGRPPPPVKVLQDAKRNSDTIGRSCTSTIQYLAWEGSQAGGGEKVKVIRDRSRIDQRAVERNLKINDRGMAKSKRVKAKPNNNEPAPLETAPLDAVPRAQDDFTSPADVAGILALHKYWAKRERDGVVF